MLAELTVQIEGADFRAGWIKLSAGDDGLTPREAKVLRAAARVSAQTGAVIGSHTIRGRVVMDQLDIIEAEGGRADRFISIHTQEEPDFGLHLAVAARGAWIEYDHIGRAEDGPIIALIERVIAAGRAGQLLLSHDLGWFDPAQPSGGLPRPYTHLAGVFLPKLAAAGIGAKVIRQLTEDNPFAAFARP